MSRESIATWLIKKPGFQRQLDSIVVDSMHREFPEIVHSNATNDINWSYMLLCGSILATSGDENCQKAALRISEHCLNTQTTNQQQHIASAIILDYMANSPSVALAIRRDLLPAKFHDSLPLPLKFDYARRMLENTVIKTGGGIFSVNHFQRDFWTAAKNKQWISISAPTSAGKSFIIKEWIEDFAKCHNTGNIVYIVPTRALNSGVSARLREAFCGD